MLHRWLVPLGFGLTLAIASAPPFRGFLLQVKGPSVLASAGVLGDHELEALATMTPQQQAERLMERALGRYSGALEEIDARLPAWQDKLEYSNRLSGLLNLAYDASDLRLRTAAIELTLTSRRIERSARTTDRLVDELRRGTKERAWALWTLGLLANRGIGVEEARRTLLDHLRDPDEGTRSWAVKSLGMFGTDDVIDPMLGVFATDASPQVRERAACSLADSGMLTLEQRKKAIPGFVRVLQDPAQSEQVRGWAVQALEEISGQRFGRDAARWSHWLAAGS